MCPLQLRLKPLLQLQQRAPTSNPQPAPTCPHLFYCSHTLGAPDTDAQGTDTGAKNELLFSRFGMNYSKLPEQFKKVGGRCCCAALADVLAASLHELSEDQQRSSQLQWCGSTSMLPSFHPS